MKTKVEFKVGKAVKMPSYKNVYELEIEYMHGDADGETTQTHWYTLDQEDELKQDLLILDNLEDGDYLATQAEKILANLGIEDSEHDLADRFQDKFYEGDMTYEGNAAPITGIELFFYDAEGIKYPVSVKFKK